MRKKKISSNVRRGPRSWDEVLAAFEQHLFTRGRAPETIRTYGAALRVFGRYYREQLKKPGPYVSRLQPEDLQSFVQHLRRQKGRSASTLNRFTSALKSFVDCALRERWLRRDIAKELRTYRAAAGEPKRLGREEVRDLLRAALPHGRNGLRDRAMLQLLLQTGVRLSELVALSVGDVTLYKTTGSLLIKGEKTRSDRRLKLNDAAHKALQAYLASRGDVPHEQPLLLSERGGRLSGRSAHYLIKKYLRLAGRDKLSAHALRHHFAVSLYESSGKLTTVQRALGHRRIETTARYARTSTAELDAALDRLPDNISLDEDDA